MENGKSRTSILYLILIVICSGVLYSCGYFRGHADLLYEAEYEIGQDATYDYKGEAEDIFMTEYTHMTQAGRDSYGKFFVIYEQSNEDCSDQYLVYTVFMEMTDSNDVLRFKIINANQEELIYKLEDIFPEGYDKAVLKNANKTGIVMTVESLGISYDVWFNLYSYEYRKIDGLYSLSSDSTYITDVLDTTGTNARLVLEEISQNYIHVGKEKDGFNGKAIQ